MIMKKIYLQPELRIVEIDAHLQMLAGSPLPDATPPGVGTAPELFSEDDLFGDEDIKQLMP
jgi:hypothetical protein